MREKILTVSVAAYNAADCVSKCIESFVNTSVIDDLEIIVVNDGSKDNTDEIVQEYVSKYPGSVRLISKENGGHGSTINTSVKESTGKYFKIVDSDDWVEKDGIEKLVNELKNVDEDLIMNSYYKVNALDGSKELVSDSRYEMHAMTVKTDLVKAMGPVIDENCFYVDTEYVLFLMSKIKTVMHLDYPVYDYLLGTATQSMNMMNLIKNRHQHIRVCKRILEFYKECLEAEIDDDIIKMIRERICDAIVTQYIIFSHMKTYESKSEVIEFDEYLKSTSTEIYDVVCDHGIAGGYNSMRIVKILRQCSFIGYPVIMGLFKAVRGLKKEQ